MSLRYPRRMNVDYALDAVFISKRRRMKQKGLGESFHYTHKNAGTKQVGLLVTPFKVFGKAPPIF